MRLRVSCLGCEECLPSRPRVLIPIRSLFVITRWGLAVSKRPVLVLRAFEELVLEDIFHEIHVKRRLAWWLLFFEFFDWLWLVGLRLRLDLLKVRLHWCRLWLRALALDNIRLEWLLLLHSLLRNRLRNLLRWHLRLWVFKLYRLLCVNALGEPEHF